MKKFKMQNVKCKIVVFLIFEFIILNFAFSGDAFSLTCNVNHSYIPINIFYHGDTVSVKGEVDAGNDLIIKITSPEENASFSKKAKVGSMFWMNKERLLLRKINKVYMLYSSQKLDKIINENDRDRYTLGYEALEKKIEMTPPEDKDVWFKEFVRLKEGSKSYTVSDGTITVTPSSNGRNYYKLLVKWPSQAPSGKYKVDVYAVKNGAVVDMAGGSLNVEQVGIVRTLANMAENNGALYGIISVVVALVGGFGIGMVFRK